MNIGFITRIKNKFRITGSGHTIDISKTAKVRGCYISIKGSNNKIVIEHNVKIRNSTIELDGNNCLIKIAKNSIIGENCYLSSRESNISLTIEENCMLSRNVKIMTSDGHDIIKHGVRVNPAKSITVGDHVWLADSVTILKGCNIDTGSVVGINSTLTKDLPSNCIAAGNPAKCIQDNINWQDELTY